MIDPLKDVGSVSANFSSSSVELVAVVVGVAVKDSSDVVDDGVGGGSFLASFSASIGKDHGSDGGRFSKPDGTSGS